MIRSARAWIRFPRMIASRFFDRWAIFSSSYRLTSGIPASRSQLSTAWVATDVAAARTLGASPVKSFFTVVVPALRNTIVATLIMVFIFALGSSLLPQILGRPQHWTLSVLITDQAIYQSNMPFAAAMAVFLVLVTLGLVALTVYAGRKGEAA